MRRRIGVLLPLPAAKILQRAVPLTARSMIHKSSGSTPIEDARASLLHLSTSLDRVTWWRRAMPIVLAALPFVLVIGLILWLVPALEQVWTTERCEVLTLLTELSGGPSLQPRLADPEYRLAVEGYQCQFLDHSCRNPRTTFRFRSSCRDRSTRTILLHDACDHRVFRKGRGVTRDFDRKFGAEFLESLPGGPGVYLVYDRQDALIYVGKAINLKRRLSQYRNTLRQKKHRRMRGIVKEASRVEIRCAETHLDACLAETLLIQKHRPRWNIVGAYSFLYPLIGIRSENGNIEFCLTTTPEAVLKDRPGFEFHGAFRSRRITGDAFFALMRLLKFVGHVNPSPRRSGIPKHSYIFSFRRLPSKWAAGWASFYKGESALALEDLILNLVDKAGARSRSSKVQEHLDQLKRFWRHEVLTLAKARKATGCGEWPVPQYRRDLVFLSYRAGVTSAAVSF